MSERVGSVGSVGNLTLSSSVVFLRELWFQWEEWKEGIGLG